MESLFTELNNAEQESLSGGAYYYFNKDKWDVYRYKNDKGEYYYKVYEQGYKPNDGGTFIN